MSKRVILLLILVEGMVLTSAVQANISNLVGYWNLDETFGHIASDSSGNGNHGKLIGKTDWVTNGGKFRGAVRFYGTDENSRIKIPAIGIKLTEGTIALWARLAQPQTKKRRNGYRFLFSYGPRLNRIQLYMNDHNTELDLGFTDDHRQHENIMNLNTKIWYHITLLWDRDKYIVYINAEQKATGTYNHFTKLPSSGDIGNNGKESGQAFHGLIDDVVIFDRALSKDEVIQLYNFGTQLFIAGPEFQALMDATKEAKAIIKKQEPQKAIIFLEEKIAEFEIWKEKNPSIYAFTPKTSSCDLYFLIAKAKEAMDLPIIDIAAAYKLAIESGTLSLAKLGASLLWLYQNVNTENYEEIIHLLIQNNSNYLKAVATQAKFMIDEQESKAAVEFLQGNLSAYKNWKDKHSHADPAVEDGLHKVYFQLAEAKEAASMPKKDIADAYAKLFYPSRFKYITERTVALIWLLNNNRTDEYTKIIKSLAQTCDKQSFFNDIVSNVCKNSESTKNWTVYEQFMDTLLAEAKQPSCWAIFLESCLSDKANEWAKQYYDYLDSKPKLKLRRDCILAEKYVEEENFKKAVELYRDIVNRCGPEERKELFQFQLYKCLFNLGKNDKAASGFERFIADNKSIHRNLVKRAILMKGQTYIKLSELDKAINDFLTLMIEYPETKEMPKIIFLTGYCYMLKNEFKAAIDAYNCLIKNHPNSSYSVKARKHLNRIKEIKNSE